MSFQDKIKQTEENIRRFRQVEQHKLLLELQIEEGILVNRLLEREEQIREMLAKFQEEKEKEELEMDGLSEPISQDRIDQRRLIYDGFEHIQDYEVRLLKELREKIAMIKAEEQRRQDDFSPTSIQEEEQRQAEEQRRQDELERRRLDELERRQEESRRQDELQRSRQEESRPQNWSFEVSREYDRMYGGRTPQELREMQESLEREREWYRRFGR